MQDKQKFGLSIEELATRETVYKENLLENHSVLITGAGSGIGAELAIVLAKLNYHTIITGRSLSSLEKTEKIDKNLLRYLTVKVKKLDLNTDYFKKNEETGKSIK